MLEELDAHLGYDKHAKSDSSNARNEHIVKNIKTGFWWQQIKLLGS